MHLFGFYFLEKNMLMFLKFQMRIYKEDRADKKTWSREWLLNYKKINNGLSTGFK